MTLFKRHVPAGFNLKDKATAQLGRANEMGVLWHICPYVYVPSKHTMLQQRRYNVAETSWKHNTQLGRFIPSKRVSYYSFVSYTLIRFN